jgi:hypothetical protein
LNSVDESLVIGKSEILQSLQNSPALRKYILDI